MRLVLVVVGLLATTSASAQDRAAYCDVPAGASRSGGDGFLNAFLDRCRPGDLVAIEADRSEWIARLCDLTRPTIATRGSIICHLGEAVKPARMFVPSQLREQPIGRPSLASDR